MHTAAHIVLVGPMGAGKSSVGRALAARMGVPFVDVDARVEEAAGGTVAAIFQAEGETGFRLREARALLEALAGAPAVIATGGGAVLAPASRDAMRSTGRVVYLRVSPQCQLERMAGDVQRPLLDAADRGQRLAELQAQREPLYREIAELVFDTTAHTPHSAAAALAAILQRRMEQPA
jgi:shikimate kinase